MSSSNENKHSEQNPWVQPGEYIYLHSKKGRFKVMKTDDAGFYVIKANQKDNSNPQFHHWSDFKRWSSHSSQKEII